MSSLIPVSFLGVIYVFNDPTRNTCKVLFTNEACLFVLNASEASKIMFKLHFHDQLFKVAFLFTFSISILVHLLPLSILKRRKVLYHLFFFTKAILLYTWLIARCINNLICIRPLNKHSVYYLKRSWLQRWSEK